MFKSNIGMCFTSKRLGLNECENIIYQGTVRINYKTSTSTGKVKGKHKQSCFIIPYSICSWLVPHFLSSFSLTVLIIFFFIKKSKSSTNLNPQRKKTRRSNNRLKCYDFRFVRKKNFFLGTIFWRQLSSGLLMWGAVIQVKNYPKGIFLRG